MGTPRKSLNLTVTKFRNKNRIFSPSKCPVYFRFPWIGPASQSFVDKIASSVSRCFNAVKVRSIFTTKVAFNSIHKDVLPIFNQSLLIYKFKCCRNSTYIGRTSQRLDVRVKQHVSRDILNTGRITSGHSQALDSAIGEQPLSINSCRTRYQDDCFSVLHRARSKIHLNILEAIYILLARPSLCRQRPNQNLYLLGDTHSSGVT